MAESAEILPAPNAVSQRRLDVSGAAVVAWLLAFVLLDWVREKLLAFPPPYALDSLPRALSALEVLEVLLLAKLFNRSAVAPRLGPVEGLAVLALVAVAGVVAGAHPMFGAALLSLYALGRFWRSAAHRPLAIGLFTFTSQYMLQSGPFIWLHALVGRFDAAVMRAVLPLLGYADVTGYSTLVIRPSQRFAIDVLEGCSSSYVASAAIPGFVIVVLGLRGRLRWLDLAFAAALLAVVTLVNWLRLIPIATSQAGWLYWHEGAGASIVSVVEGLLVAGAAYLAASRAEGRA